MSARALNWAWEQTPLTTTQKLVLAALADRADDDGECWPSIRWIVDKCQPITEQTAKRAVADLAKQGLVTKVERKRKANGDYSVWIYRLPIAQVTSDTCAQVTDDTCAGITHDLTETSSNDSKKNPYGFSTVVDHWLSLSPPLIEHKPSSPLVTKARSLVDAVVAAHGADDVKAAITAYAEVLSSPAHWLSHRWTFHLFFKQANAFPMFLPEAEPMTNFLNREPTSKGRDRGVSFNDILNGGSNDASTQSRAGLPSGS